MKHVKLHLLLLSDFVSQWVHTVLAIQSILSLILRIIDHATHRHLLLIFLLNQTSSSLILKVTLLLVSFYRNVGIDTVEIFLLLSKHFNSNYYLILRSINNLIYYLTK